MARATLTLICLAAVLALGAAPAGATITWTSNGTAAGTAFVATGTAAQFSIVPGLPGATLTTQCTGSRIDGTLYGPSALGTEWPQSMKLNPTYTGCTTSGAATTVTCATIDAYYHALTVAAGVVNGFIQDYTCTIGVLSPSCDITVAGNIYDATYTNATGRFVLPVTGTPLTAGEDFHAAVTTTGCNSLFGTPQSSATVRMGNKPAGGLEPLPWTLTVTSGVVPTLSTDP